MSRSLKPNNRARRGNRLLMTLTFLKNLWMSSIRIAAADLAIAYSEDLWGRGSTITEEGENANPLGRGSQGRSQ